MVPHIPTPKADIHGENVHKLKFRGPKKVRGSQIKIVWRVDDRLFGGGRANGSFAQKVRGCSF